MAHNTEGPKLPLFAASAIAQYVPVQFLQGGSSLNESVIPAGSINIFAVGMTEATVPTYGMEVAVKYGSVSKAIAGASLGAGALVGVGSTNGILIPLTASNIASAANGSGLRYQVGVALKNAAAGDIFPILVKPDQIV
jgi:hypothetical protein